MYSARSLSDLIGPRHSLSDHKLEILLVVVVNYQTFLIDSLVVPRSSTRAFGEWDLIDGSRINPGFPQIRLFFFSFSIYKDLHAWPNDWEKVLMELVLDDNIVGRTTGTSGLSSTTRMTVAGDVAMPGTLEGWGWGGRLWTLEGWKVRPTLLLNRHYRGPSRYCLLT